ncbi:unnamed protein product [Calypogeia fissa]
MPNVNSDGLPQVGKAFDLMDMDLDLGHILGSLSDAQYELIKVERKWLSRVVAVRDEIYGLKGALADETKRLTDTQLALQERETKIAALEGERDAALAAPKESRKKEKANRKAASMFKRARRNTKHTVQAFDAIVTALQVQQRKVEAESAEFKREANAQLTSKEMEKTNYKTKSISSSSSHVPARWATQSTSKLPKILSSCSLAPILLAEVFTKWATQWCFN